MNPDSADIAELAVIKFKPPETEAVTRRIELGQALPVRGAEHIALRASLGRSAHHAQDPS